MVFYGAIFLEVMPPGCFDLPSPVVEAVAVPVVPHLREAILSDP
jgi:hypothetical protein